MNIPMEQNSLEIDPHKYTQLIFDKRAKATHEAKTVSSTNWTSTWKKMNLQMNLTPLKN